MIMSNDISNFRNNLLLKFEDMGISKFKDYCIRLISDLEKKRGEEYNVLRGELAEVLLEALLRDLCDIMEKYSIKYELIKNLAMLKRGDNGKLYSSEIDVCICTEYRCYLFEVKSYKGKKTLTDECLLHGHSDMNIYEQSRIHLDFFRHIFDDCRYKFAEGRENIGKPFSLLFFEFSSDGVEDLRSNEWKERIKLINYRNFYKFFISELENNQVQWDLNKLRVTLKKLNENRDIIMKYHVDRLKMR